ncbi:hypothetical protein BJ970_006450 [Saccharopolyspora phatthalungensis]|uniref:Uncharacterized protein n=1 Tax=Saccharopolyspora phatthalungensis TaxID=664693 RepID=A0A840QFK2_9PSEU|nr:hypothetical protein [Saccharopolyspora phatthalungensis]
MIEACSHRDLATTEITETFASVRCTDCLAGHHRWTSVRAEAYAAILTRWHCACWHCHCDAREVTVGVNERYRSWRLLRRVQHGLDPL